MSDENVIYEPEWTPPGTGPLFFSINGVQFMAGYFENALRDEGTNKGYIAALCEGGPGAWVPVVAGNFWFETEWERGQTPEWWADADIRDYNEYLADRFDNLPDLPPFEEWMRDMQLQVNRYRVQGNQLVLEE